MRHVGIMIAVVMLLTSSSAWALKTYPNDMNAFTEKYSTSARTNINPRATRKSAQQSEFPQGKNAFEKPSAKVVATSKAPTKPICVGNDCGCTSGKNR